jgi:hypothetical protein
MTTRSFVAPLAVAAVLSMAALHSAPAHADPNGYDDDPGYTTNDDGGGQPGTEHFPRSCQTTPIACGLHFDPGPGTWLRPPAEPYH